MAVRRLSQVRSTFKALRAGGKNASRNAAFAGARYLRDAERKAAPRDSGVGARTIIAKREESRPGVGLATVRVTRPGFYLHILEVGAKPHVITVASSHRVVNPRTRATVGKELGRRALALGRGLRGRSPFAFSRRVQHPGVPARRWFRSTYERERANTVERMQTTYAAQLQQQAQKKGL